MSSFKWALNGIFQLNRMTKEQNIKHFKGALGDFTTKTIFWSTSHCSIDGHVSEMVLATRVDLRQPGGKKKENIEDSEQKCVWLTYIVEKGEHCQPVWFISGLSEALVLVRVVMDNMELENKVEIQVGCQIQMEERQIIRHYRTLSGKYSEKKKRKERISFPMMQSQPDILRSLMVIHVLCCGSEPRQCNLQKQCWNICLPKHLTSAKAFV